MFYGWDAGKSAFAYSFRPHILNIFACVLGGIQATPQFLDAIGNPTGPQIIPVIYRSTTSLLVSCHSVSAPSVWPLAGKAQSFLDVF